MAPDAQTDRPSLRLKRVCVVGSSMLPVLTDGDWIIVLQGAPVRVGDIVVSCRPDQPGRRIVKQAVCQMGTEWWLAGANRSASDDSRTFGPVAQDWIEGTVVARYWPKPRLLMALNSVASVARLALHLG